MARPAVNFRLGRRGLSAYTHPVIIHHPPKGDAEPPGETFRITYGADDDYITYGVGADNYITYGA